MGYTTTFDGVINVDPPLSDAEVAYLKKFSRTRRMNCQQGPYYVDRGGGYGQDHGPDVIDYNEPPAGQPGLWCKWVPTDDGEGIEWDGNEKFYESVEWMQYLIDHFIGPSPLAQNQLPFFTGHNCNGQLEASGEEAGDLWLLVVKNNKASERRGKVVYQDEAISEGTIIEGDYIDLDKQRLLR